jgi:hypothetical protein
VKETSSQCFYPPSQKATGAETVVPNHGMGDLVEQLEKSSPTVQRVLITTYYQWFEYPESFGTAWKWVLRFYPVTRAYAWIK